VRVNKQKGGIVKKALPLPLFHSHDICLTKEQITKLIEYGLLNVKNKEELGIK
jgi:hypothetical protein